LKRPEVKLEQLIHCCKLNIPEERESRLTIEADIKYSGFVAKEKAKIEKIRQLEDKKIPELFEYDKVKGLLTESLIKLKKVRPSTLGQASRIPGVTPADISIIGMHLLKKHRQKTDVSHETINIKEQETI